MGKGVLSSVALALHGVLANGFTGDSHISPVLDTRTMPGLEDNQAILILDPELISAQFPNAEAIQNYSTAVARPSPHLSEYYGLHVLQPVGKEDVIRDFDTFESFSVADADGRGNSMRVANPSGGSGNVTFHFNKRLAKDDGSIVDSGHSYAWFQSIDVDNLLLLIDSFHVELEESGLSSKYLLSNNHFDLETQDMARLLTGSDHRVSMTPDPNRSKFRSAGSNALLAVPDAVHGDPKRYADILDILQHENIDWFGIEMYTQSVQSTINTFLSSPSDSPTFRTAKQKLLDISWKNFDEHEESPEENYYLHLLEVCRRRGIQVYAMDIDMLYDLFGHGETPFGAMVRNSFWSKVLPESGRGVLFGGSAHFQGSSPIQGHQPLFVQDFLADVYRGEKLLVFPSE